MESSSREDTGNIIEHNSFGMWTFTQPFIMMMLVYFYLYHTLCITKQWFGGYSALIFINDKRESHTGNSFWA